MVLASGIVTVFASIREEVMLVVEILCARTAVDEIMAITVGVPNGDGETATDGALALMGHTTHPLQRDGSGLRLGNALWLGGKTRAPHLGQYVEVRDWCGGHQCLCPSDILKGTTPLDVCLQNCNFHNGLSFDIELAGQRLIPRTPDGWRRLDNTLLHISLQYRMFPKFNQVSSGALCRGRLHRTYT